MIALQLVCLALLHAQCRAYAHNSPTNFAFWIRSLKADAQRQTHSISLWGKHRGADCDRWPLCECAQLLSAGGRCALTAASARQLDKHAQSKSDLDVLCGCTHAIYGACNGDSCCIDFLHLTVTSRPDRQSHHSRAVPQEALTKVTCRVICSLSLSLSLSHLRVTDVTPKQSTSFCTTQNGQRLCWQDAWVCGTTDD